MMEIDDVSTFVSSVVQDDTVSDSVYISREQPDSLDVHSLVYHLHSPLDMYVTSDQGVLSSATNSIPGALYRRFGEVQYIILPTTITGATLHLAGYRAGSFTLVAEAWNGLERQVVADYRAIPNATSTYAVLDIPGTTTLRVDFNGDGTIDGRVSPDRDKLEKTTTTPIMLVRSSNSSSKLNTTRVQKLLPTGQVAGISTTSELEKIEKIVLLLQQIMQLIIKLRNYENN